MCHSVHQQGDTNSRRHGLSHQHPVVFVHQKFSGAVLVLHVVVLNTNHWIAGDKINKPNADANLLANQGINMNDYKRLYVCVCNFVWVLSWICMLYCRYAGEMGSFKHFLRGLSLSLCRAWWADRHLCETPHWC